MDFIKKIKMQISNSKESARRIHVRKLSELNSLVVSAHLSVELEFRSGVLRNPVVEKYQKDYSPDDIICCLFNCPNSGCTQGFFDISFEVEDLIINLKNGSGQLKCGGKEDFKYINSCGCSCMTTLSYDLTLEHK